MIDDIAFLDDSTRPRGPRLEGVTEAQRRPGQHLRMIHDHLRENMGVLRDLLERAGAGEASPREIAEETARLDIVENYRRFGTLCGRYCQFVHMHHSIEDEAIFPELSAKSAALARVAERLKAEHVVVHELLVRLVGALGTLAREPTETRFSEAHTLYAALEKVLLSHLGYEEEEIGDALGYFGIGL